MSYEERKEQAKKEAIDELEKLSKETRSSIQIFFDDTDEYLKITIFSGNKIHSEKHVLKKLEKGGEANGVSFKDCLLAQFERRDIRGGIGQKV